MDRAQRLIALRKALGVSVSKMAETLGLEGEKSGDHLREMERNDRPVSGPLDKVIRYLEQAVEVDEDSHMSDMTFQVLPEWLDCDDLENEEDGAELIMHTRFPRFYGVLIEELPNAVELHEAGMTLVKLSDELGLGWMVILWIDEPINDVAPLLKRAAQLKTVQAMRDLGV